MDERLGRFKYCDPRLYPYLDRVFSRLPPDFREEILNDRGFQIISDATLPDVCGHCFMFDQPLETLIYLNPAIIKQPDHRLECSIALELAEYATNKEKRNGDMQRIQERLENLRSQVSQNRLLPAAAMREEKELPKGVTVDEVFIEGVMAAVKEIKMQGRVEA